MLLLSMRREQNRIMEGQKVKKRIEKRPDPSADAVIRPFGKASKKCEPL